METEPGPVSDSLDYVFSRLLSPVDILLFAAVTVQMSLDKKNRE
jgi:hypothetical protein